jgi:citrate lyase subunit beta/citryl-CoA lyase
VLASRLAGIEAPLDRVTAQIGEDAPTQDDACYAAELGFGGKLPIHPRQVAPAQRGFAHAAEEWNGRARCWPPAGTARWPWKG